MNAHHRPSVADSSNPGQHMLDGTIWLSLAHALIPLTGFVTAIFLSRQLGPANYGLLTLVGTLIISIQLIIGSLLSPVAIKLIAESQEWRPLGAKFLWLFIWLGCGAMVVLWLMADSIATLLDVPIIATYLRLFALDIPFFALVNAHYIVLTGTGLYRHQAVASASHWSARLLLIIVFVELGWSVQGAILGMLGASLIQLIVCRWYIRPPLFGFPSSVSTRSLLSYAGPTFLATLSLQLFRLDLVVFKSMGGTVEEAGFYGAASNLVIIPTLIAASLNGFLLSTLTGLLSAGDTDSARHIVRNVLRGPLWFLPFACLIAGAASEIVVLIYGTAYLAAAPLLALLMFAGVAQAVISVTLTMIIAAGKPGWTFALAGPLVPFALIGYLLLIPPLGAIGAALVTTLCTSIGALASVLAVYRLWDVLPPGDTLWRSLLICGLAYLLAASWPTPGLLLLVKLPVIGLGIILAFRLLREFSLDEIILARSMLRRLRGTP